MSGDWYIFGSRLNERNKMQLTTIEGPGPLNPIQSHIDWSKPVQTKRGLEVHIIAIDHRLTKPVIGVVLGTGTSVSTDVSQWYYNGLYLNASGYDCLDLQNVTEAEK